MKFFEKRKKVLEGKKRHYYGKKFVVGEQGNILTIVALNDEKYEKIATLFDRIFTTTHLDDPSANIDFKAEYNPHSCSITLLPIPNKSLAEYQASLLLCLKRIEWILSPETQNEIKQYFDKQNVLKPRR